MGNSALKAKNLISIDDLSDSDIEALFSQAKKYRDENSCSPNKENLLRGKTIINLFYEHSTRTRTSFEIAGKRLSADVVNVSVAQSSVSKGENLADTLRSLDAMGLSAIILRHSMSGAAELASKLCRARIINAGDGCHEHPTQALLDALTIQEHLGSLAGKKIVICGDILHSRVARSNIKLLTRLGADISLVAPPTLLPPHLSDTLAVSYTHCMEDGLESADVIMMLRLQRERMQTGFVPSVRDYFYGYGLTRARLNRAKPKAIVLHPGPLNRGVEIASDVADDQSQSRILNQVELGVAMRQAVLALLLA